MAAIEQTGPGGGSLEAPVRLASMDVFRGFVMVLMMAEVR